MKKVEHLIKEVYPGSIAEELEIEPGDVLLSINDQSIEDVFDNASGTIFSFSIRFLLRFSISCKIFISLCSTLFTSSTISRLSLLI